MWYGRMDTYPGNHWDILPEIRQFSPEMSSFQVLFDHFYTFLRGTGPLSRPPRQIWPSRGQLVPTASMILDRFEKCTEVENPENHDLISDLEKEKQGVPKGFTFIDGYSQIWSKTRTPPEFNTFGQFRINIFEMPLELNSRKGRLGTR